MPDSQDNTEQQTDAVVIQTAITSETAPEPLESAPEPALTDKTSDLAQNNGKIIGSHPGMANLVYWKPGQSGNPGGRPKKKPITELYEQMLSDPKLVEQLRGSIEKALTRGQMAMVLQLKEMTDRVEGKVTQPIEADVTVNLADAIANARKRAGK